MEKEMEVLYVEGVAIHGGPESCVGVPRGRSEALTGDVWAGLLSRENCLIGVLTSSRLAEGHAADGAIASRRWTPRGRRTRARTESLCMGTGRSHGRPWAYDDAPSWTVRGVAYRRRSGRGGNAEAVIPR
jgi:hypothetical protein